MKKTLVCIFLISTLANVFPATDQANPEPGGEKVHDAALIDVPDQPGLPRVLLIGDSISLGYTLPLRKLLEGKANLHRVGQNGGPTTNGLLHLDEWLAAGNQPGEAPKTWDVIHFNFGLHDLKIMKQDSSGPQRQVSPQDYEKNLRQIVERLHATGAKLIWASTTPIPDSATLRPPRLAADVLQYNEIAARVMTENSIPIDDLYAVASANLAKHIQSPNNVHFSAAGYQLFAQKAAECILAQLGAPAPAH